MTSRVKNVDRDLGTEEVGKLGHAQTPPLRESPPGGEEILRAGHVPGRRLMAVCTTCNTGVGVPADAPLPACENCRGNTFRAVMAGERRGEVVHAGQTLGRPVMAVCTACESEVGVKARAAMLPCEHCRGRTFRIVS